jgi:hypothetical protein
MVQSTSIFVGSISVGASTGGGPGCKEGEAGAAIQLGHAYEALFDSDKQSYDLVMKSFTGEEFYVIPGHADPVLDVSEENQSSFKRLVVKLKNPY